MRILAAVLSWSGRALAVGCFAVWGMFFVEHLGWFMDPGRGLPPVRVWLLQLAHLVLLAGLLVLLRWEIAGSIVTIAAALVFFAEVAGPRFLLFFGVTIVPVILVLLGRALQYRLSWSSPGR